MAPTRRTMIEPISVAEIADGYLQEGQDLDFKRLVNLDDDKGKKSLLDDVVAFLNRGPSRIIVGVDEKGGRFDHFSPLKGDADKFAMRVQTLIQDSITPVPADVQVVPVHLDEGFVLDIQIPRHPGGPFMNRTSGTYLIRSGARNLPIDPGMLRSRFVDETNWMRRLDELTLAEDAAVAGGGRLVLDRALRVAILPREHFDHRRAPFSQDDHVRRPAPSFSEHGRHWFKVCQDGHEALSSDMREQGIERLFIRDDWFVHAHIAYALQQRQGEGRLALHEFETETRTYLADLAEFFCDVGIDGPFAVTLALQSLGKTEHFGEWFRTTKTVRTLRPQLVSTVDDAALVDDFLRRIRQASILG